MIVCMTRSYLSRETCQAGHVSKFGNTKVTQVLQAGAQETFVRRAASERQSRIPSRSRVFELIALLCSS